MTTDEYVPSDEDVRSVWVVHERDCGWDPHPGDPSAEFDRFMARVRREAKAEAWDEGYDSGYQDHIDRAWDPKPGRNPYRTTEKESRHD